MNPLNSPIRMTWPFFKSVYLFDYYHYTICLFFFPRPFRFAFSIKRDFFPRICARAYIIHDIIIRYLFFLILFFFCSVLFYNRSGLTICKLRFVGYDNIYLRVLFYFASRDRFLSFFSGGKSMNFFIKKKKITKMEFTGPRFPDDKKIATV